MVAVLRLLLPAALARLRSRFTLEIENLALRHQVNVLRRAAPTRIRPTGSERLLFVWLYRLWPGVLRSITILRPETVVRWHRQGWRAYWRSTSRGTSGRSKVAAAAFLYDGTIMHDLGTLGGTNSSGYGINASGEVTGYAWTTGNADYHAFLYDGTSMHDLGTLGGLRSLGYAINASGEVAGWANTTGNAGSHAFLLRRYDHARPGHIRRDVQPGVGNQ
jgi:probable HAF family extracellular repeat protein